MIASPTLYINVTNYLNVTNRGHVHLNIIWNCVSVYSWVTCWTREFRSAVSMFKKNTVYEIILTLKNRWGLWKSCMLLPWQQEENKHWGSYLNICFTSYAKSTTPRGKKNSVLLLVIICLTYKVTFWYEKDVQDLYVYQVCFLSF